MLGLLGYAIGALAMALAQGLTAIIIFWAVLGGLGASLLLPSMQSLIHGNFEGPAQKRVYVLVGAAAAIAAAVGPLIGGFITTYLSWRVAFLLEVLVIGIVLSGIKLVRDVEYTGPRASTWWVRSSRSWAWAASCWASSCGRRAGRPLAHSLRSVPLPWPGSSTGSCGASARDGRHWSTPTCSRRSCSGSGSPSRCSSSVNSAAGSFGLSFGLAFAGAILLATLSVTFTNKADASTVLPPDDQERVAQALEDDAEVMSNTQLEQLLADQPEDIQDEIIRINTDARPIALQVALLVPILAGLVGFFNGFRMMRLPDPVSSSSVEGMALG